MSSGIACLEPIIGDDAHPGTALHPKPDPTTSRGAPMTKLFPEISAPGRTASPRERLLARLPGQIPFPQAPRGKDGGLGCAITGILLTGIFNIFMFFVVRMFDLSDPTYSNLFVFYYVMSFILGLFAIICVVFLIRGMHFAVNMAIIYSGILFIHNYFFLHAKPAMLFPRYLAPISTITLFYFIFSKRVRNTYCWIDGDNGEDSTS